MPDHISHTQVQMLLKCGIQYEKRYIDGEIIPPSASLTRGKCGHTTLEYNFRQKVKSERDVTDEAIRDVFSDQWEENRRAIAWSEKDLAGDSVSKAEGRWKDSGIGMVSAFHSERSPQIQPAHVEFPVDVEFGAGVPKLKAVIDRVDRDKSIKEVKFVSKSPSAGDVDTDIQLTIYDMAYRALFGEAPSGLGKQWAVGTKVPETVEQVCRPRSQDTLDRLMNRLWVAMEAIKRGAFLPAAHGSWWCSPVWCGYWQGCKYHP